MERKVKLALLIFSGIVFIGGAAIVIIFSSWKLFGGIFLLMWADNISRNSVNNKLIK